MDKPHYQKSQSDPSDQIGNKKLVGHGHIGRVLPNSIAANENEVAF